jgi:predicted dehydrogenase
VLNLACVGLGYWGPNVLRAFAGLEGCRLVAACDQDPARRERVRQTHPEVALTGDYADLLRDPRIEAIAITTPAASHHRLAKAALESGRHVFVEKPLALAGAEAEELARLAEQRGLILMVGHLLQFHPAVQQLKRYLDGGRLGSVFYLYSTRVNLGQVRQDESALWSLAPHDVSVFLYLLGRPPVAVRAVGGSYLQAGVEDVVFLTCEFAGGVLAHSHLSWLDPHKLRKFTVVGTKMMAVFDDMEPVEKIRLYDKGVDAPADFQSYGEFLTLRSGDVFIPKVSMEEPLLVECRHFLECVRDKRRPLTDGRAGLAVVRVLEAATASLQARGAPVPVEAAPC